VQTTLLGLAIAIILALVAALVAPFVVDWNNYRTALETEAGRMTGFDVRVHGSIDARILPNPRLTLHDIEISAANRGPSLRAGSLELELGLGPLLTGKLRATQARLVAPKIDLRLDRSGVLDIGAPGPSLLPNALSISHFAVEDGRLAIDDAASGSHLTLQNISFDGDIRSVLGPFQGEGTVVAFGERYGYRLSGSRTDGDAGLKVRLDLEPADQPFTAAVEGMVTLDRGAPLFDGTLELVRPVGVTLASGRRLLREPWHLRGGVRLTPAGGSLKDAAFQYGPDENPLNLTGAAALSFGNEPRLDGSVAAMQIDVDRALAEPDTTHRPPLFLIADFAKAVAAAHLPVAAKVAIGTDAIKVGGTVLSSLHGNALFDGSGWQLQGIEFHAPGLTQVNLSGRFADDTKQLAFSGPVELQSADVNALLTWLSGRPDQARDQIATESRTLVARGDVTIAHDRVAVDAFAATLGRQNLTGSLAYAWPAQHRPAALDLNLRAAQLDLDAVTGFARSALAGGNVDWPSEGTLSLEIGGMRFAGVDARAVKASAKYDSGVLQIDKISIGDIGGATLDIGGRIDDLSSRPRGRVSLDLDARALSGLTGVIGKVAPQAASALRHFADRLAPAKLHAILAVDHAALGGSTAKLDLTGELGVARIALNSEASGEVSRLGASIVRVDGRLDADDGEALTALFDLDRVAGVDQLPGRVTLKATGPLDGDLRVDVQLAASGLNTAVAGKLRIGGGDAPTGAFQVLASVADLGPLQHMMTGQAGPAVGVSARAAVNLGGRHISVTDMTGDVGKSRLRGHLALELSDPLKLDGDIAATDAEASGVMAMLLGLPKETAGRPSWSSAPIGPGAFAPIDGAVRFKLDHAELTPTLEARDLTGVMTLRPGSIGFDNVEGSLAGGHLAAALGFHRNNDVIAADLRGELSGADATALIAPAHNAIGGKLTIRLEGAGSGGSAADLIGSLHGGGTIALDGGSIAGIDPAVFTAAIGAADRDSSSLLPKIQTVVEAAMAKGRLTVADAKGAVTVASGRMSLADAELKGQDEATLSVHGMLDLNAATLDVRMTLSGHPPSNAMIDTPPQLDIAVKGPFAAPVRSFDLSALTGWLALRAAELQTRRIESIEASRRDGLTDPAIRPGSPLSRPPVSGSLVENGIIAGVPAGSGAGGKGPDRLQPELSADAPDGGHPGDRTWTPPLPVPRTAGPDHRSPFDFLFRPQN